MYFFRFDMNFLKSNIKFDIFVLEFFIIIFYHYIKVQIEYFNLPPILQENIYL